MADQHHGGAVAAHHSSDRYAAPAPGAPYRAVSHISEGAPTPKPQSIISTGVEVISRFILMAIVHQVTGPGGPAGSTKKGGPRPPFRFSAGCRRDTGSGAAG